MIWMPFAQVRISHNPMTPPVPLDKLYRILLIEDNPMDIDLTKRAFTREDLAIEFDVAKDGEEALDYIKKWDADAPLPIFILLDLKLPKIDGLQVLREIKAHSRYRAIPIVVLTSSSEDRDIETAYKLGANSYIIKEIDFDKFLEIAAEVEHYWCMINVLPRL
jgi:CheY-like chemotaxis protein